MLLEKLIPLPSLEEVHATANDLCRRLTMNTPAFIDAAYEIGREAERKRVLQALRDHRDGLNAQRGGMPCDKPYLQPVNHQIELLDLLIKQVSGWEATEDGNQSS